MQTAVPPPPRPRRSPRVILLTLLLLAVAFAAGYVPQWLQVRRMRTTLAATSLDLQLATLHRELGVASHEAQRNNYGSASESAARFFDACAKLAHTETFQDDDRTRVALLGYAAQRDEVMALLAAADPAARERLAGLYLTMNGVLGRRRPD